MASVAKRIKLSHISARPSLAAYRLPIRRKPRFIKPYATQAKPPSSQPGQEQPKGPNQDVLGHVSEEAAEVSEVMGETGPDISQGTPIQEVSNP